MRSILIIGLSTLALATVAVEAAVSSDSIQFTDCGASEVTGVYVTGCTPKDKICSLYRKRHTSMEMVFVANQNTTTVSLDMSADVGGFDREVPFLDTNACNGHGLDCPLVKGRTYRMKYDIVLPDFLPKVGL